MIQAGDAAEQSDREIIAKQIEANRQTNPGRPEHQGRRAVPFRRHEHGRPPSCSTRTAPLTYRGTDERIKYALSNVLTGGRLLHGQ